jgi:hypothetical protein
MLAVLGAPAHPEYDIVRGRYAAATLPESFDPGLATTLLRRLA